MIDLRRSTSVTGLSDRDLAVVSKALGIHKTDLMGMRRLAEAAGLPVEIGRYARLILEVELLLVKVGIPSHNTTGNEEERTT